jgi:hypothetical protein
MGSAVSLNRSIHSDAQVLPAAARPRLMGAGDFRRYRSKMKEVVALALAAGSARRLAVAIESGWHHVPGNCASLACGRPVVRAQHFSGGPSRALGPVAAQRVIAPAAFQVRRALAKAVAARCQEARNLGLALAMAASDNKSVNTDAQGRPAAVRRRSLVAGYLQR